MQTDIFNASRINTTVLCVLSSNTTRAKVPGNILILQGSTGLPKDSVVITTQLITVDKSELFDKIGRVTPKQLSRILDGVVKMLQPA